MTRDCTLVIDKTATIFKKTGKKTFPGTVWGVEVVSKGPGLVSRAGIKYVDIESCCSVSLLWVGSLPSGIVGGGGDVPAGARPVSVDVLPGFGQQLVGVRSKVVSLSLVSGSTRRTVTQRGGNTGAPTPEPQRWLAGRQQPAAVRWGTVSPQWSDV